MSNKMYSTNIAKYNKKSQISETVQTSNYKNYKQLYIIDSQYNLLFTTINTSKFKTVLKNYVCSSENYNILINEYEKIKRIKDEYYKVISTCDSYNVINFNNNTDIGINRWKIHYKPIYNIPVTKININVHKEYYNISDHIRFCVEYNHIKNTDINKNKNENPYIDCYFEILSDINEQDCYVKNTIFSFLNEFK